MANPKPLPAALGQRVPMISAMRSGRVRAGYPWEALRVGDYFVVPEHVRTYEMVRQAASQRGRRHHETYQTKLLAEAVMVVRIR